MLYITTHKYHVIIITLFISAIGLIIDRFLQSGSRYVPIWLVRDHDKSRVDDIRVFEYIYLLNCIHVLTYLLAGHSNG